MWKWGPTLLAAYEREGLEWEVVKDIPNSDLGSSPGDVYFDGQKVFIEERCPQAWVAHELAHLLVCRRDNPEYVGKKNYGFEDADYKKDLRLSKTERDPHNWYERTEAVASDVTVGLLIRLRLPWHECAHELGVKDSYWPLDRKPPHPFCNDFTFYRNDKVGWKVVREAVVKSASPYLG